MTNWTQARSKSDVLVGTYQRLLRLESSLVSTSIDTVGMEKAASDPPNVEVTSSASASDCCTQPVTTTGIGSEAVDSANAGEVGGDEGAAAAAATSLLATWHDIVRARPEAHESVMLTGIEVAQDGSRQQSEK